MDKKSQGRVTDTRDHGKDVSNPNLLCIMKNNCLKMETLGTVS